MSTDDIITFNEELEFLSTSIIKIVNIDKSSHEHATVNFVTKNSRKQKTILL